MENLLLRSFTIVFEFFFVVGLKYLLEIKVRFFKVASLNSNELKSDQTHSNLMTVKTYFLTLLF